MIKEHDYTIGLFIGFFIAVFLIPVFYATQFFFPVIIPLEISFFAISIPFGLWCGAVLQEAFGVGARFARYAASGLLSFSIDFGILNSISIATGITAGAAAGWINVPGFLVALINAYLWNKLWVFEKFEGSHWKHFPRFFLVVGIGMVINSLMLVLLTSGNTPALFSATEWLNIAKIVATGIAIIWNFLGYRFFAFREL